jgi:SET domain-containing protein
MLFIRTEAGASPIAGKGVFAREAVKRGEIVGIAGHRGRIVTEAEYQAAQEAGDTLLIQSAIRWVGDYFVYNETITDEEYVNHATDPNLLYHCGVWFARRDIEPGDELTCDYKYFLAVDDVCRFPDAGGQGMVSGLPGKEALVQSAEELIALLKDGDLGAPRHTEYAPAK